MSLQVSAEYSYKLSVIAVASKSISTSCGGVLLPVVGDICVAAEYHYQLSVEFGVAAECHFKLPWSITTSCR